MTHYLVKTRDDFRYEIYERGLLRYYKVSDQVFNTKEEAYDYIYDHCLDIPVKIDTI